MLKPKTLAIITATILGIILIRKQRKKTLEIKSSGYSDRNAGFNRSQNKLADRYF